MAREAYAGTGLPIKSPYPSLQGILQVTNMADSFQKTNSFLPQSIKAEKTLLELLTAQADIFTVNIQKPECLAPEA